MADLWTVLAPIVLADVINPVLFAFMVYSAGSNRPISNTILGLVGLGIVADAVTSFATGKGLW